MKKYNSIYFSCIALLFICTVLVFFKIKHYNYEKKVLLAQETHRVLESLMFDFTRTHLRDIQGIPEDGQWHQQEIRGYFIKDGQLWHGNQLISKDIDQLWVRRKPAAANILEIKIEARKGVTITSNLNLRVRP